MGKKKGAANKLARMSDEERARYLQHRADIEEEARRRKQQLIAVYMKNKLRREEAFARLNLAKINQEWRTVLRNLKCTELRDELRAVEQQFTVALERKQKEITRLLTELDVCEEQYGRMRDAHVLNVSALVGLHGERAEFWRTGYLGDKKELMNTFHTEMAVYKQRKLESRADLECVLYGAEARVEKRLLEAKEAQALRMDGVKSKVRTTVIFCDQEFRQLFLMQVRLVILFLYSSSQVISRNHFHISIYSLCYERNARDYELARTASNRESPRSWREPAR